MVPNAVMCMIRCGKCNLKLHILMVKSISNIPLHIVLTEGEPFSELEVENFSYSNSFMNILVRRMSALDNTELSDIFY